MKRIYLLLSVSFFLTHAIARAGVVDITLQEPVLSGSPGDVLAFFGTITNTTGAQVFLNADIFNGIPPGYIDDSPFSRTHPTATSTPTAQPG